MPAVGEPVSKTHLLKLIFIIGEIAVKKFCRKISYRERSLLRAPGGPDIFFSRPAALNGSHN
jgi:hypothetical protein